MLLVFIFFDFCRFFRLVLGLMTLLLFLALKSLLYLFIVLVFLVGLRSSNLLFLAFAFNGDTDHCWGLFQWLPSAHFSIRGSFVQYRDGGLNLLDFSWRTVPALASGC
jgi:hypothetical protein